MCSQNGNFILNYDGINPSLLVKSLMRNPKIFKSTVVGGQRRFNDNVIIKSTIKKTNLDRFLLECIHNSKKYNVISWKFQVYGKKVSFLDNFLIKSHDSPVSWMICYKIAQENAFSVLLDADILIINSQELQNLQKQTQ